MARLGTPYYGKMNIFVKKKAHLVVWGEEYLDPYSNKFVQIPDWSGHWNSFEWCAAKTGLLDLCCCYT